MLCAAFFALIAGGCQKDSDALPAYLKNDSLTGKWYLKNLTRQTSADTSINILVDSVTSFTTDDYFEFKADNSATYSSTNIGKRYNGYYSANSSVTPYVLTFKSGSYVNQFDISKVSKDSLVLYKTQSATGNAVTTTTTDYYIYTH